MLCCGVVVFFFFWKYSLQPWLWQISHTATAMPVLHGSCNLGEQSCSSHHSNAEIPLLLAAFTSCLSICLQSSHSKLIFKPALCWQPLWGKALFASSQQQLADGNMISVWDEALNFCPVTCRWQRRVLSTVQMQTDQMWQNVSFAW